MFVCFVTPAFFGLQNSTQWGGMYDNHWCHAELFSRDPGVHQSKQPLRRRIVTAGYTSRVYSSPAHNRMTCLVWSRTYCGKKDPNGWAIAWVNPVLQAQEYINGANACDLDLPGTEDWFTFPDAEK